MNLFRKKPSKVETLIQLREELNNTDVLHQSRRLALMKDINKLEKELGL